MIDRFKRAIRYRKWAILLFPLVGPVGVVIGGALTSNSFDVTGMAIHYFGMVVMVIAFFMAKDDYKELND